MTAQEQDKEISKALALANPFRYLNEVQIKTVQQFGQFMHFSKEDILQQGKPGHGLYVIIKGKVNVSVIALGAGKIRLAQLSPGNIFGEVSLLENTPCTATVSAEQQVQCFLLDRKSYDAFYTLMPEIRYLINRSLVEDVVFRQREMLENIKYLMGQQKQVNEKKLPDLLQKNSIVPFSLEKKRDEFNYLHKLPIFQSFGEEEFDQLLKNIRVLETSKGDAFIKKNQLSTSCYFIVSGSAQVSIDLETSRSRLAVLGPNTFICPSSLIDKKPEMFHYLTNDPAVLLELNVADLENLVEKNSLLWYKCYDLACRYIVSLQPKLNSLVLRLSNETLESIEKE